MQAAWVGGKESGGSSRACEGSPRGFCLGWPGVCQTGGTVLAWGGLRDEPGRLHWAVRGSARPPCPPGLSSDSEPAVLPRTCPAHGGGSSWKRRWVPGPRCPRSDTWADGGSQGSARLVGSTFIIPVSYITTRLSPHTSS